MAQIGLVLAVVGQRDILGDGYLYIAGGILLAHAVGKAGLYWLSGLVAGRDLTAWSALRGNPLLLFAFVSFVALLIGLPPFPGFYAKWELIHHLAGEGRLLLLGADPVRRADRGGLPVPLVRLRHQARTGCRAGRRRRPTKRRGAVAAVAAGWALGYLWGELSGHGNLLHAMPMLFAFAFLLLEWSPAWFKNSLAIAGMVAWFV